jgi:hypothetical protein
MNRKELENGRNYPVLKALDALYAELKRVNPHWTHSRDMAGRTGTITSTHWALNLRNSDYDNDDA